MKITEQEEKDIRLITALRFWLQGSLNCDLHVWEPDQRVVAQETVDEAIKRERHIQ